VTQAALPYLREQGSGHCLQVSSIGAISAFANVGMYHASRWALEGISQSLAREVASPGDPVATRDAVLPLVDSDDPPPRIFFGDGLLEIARLDCESRLATWAKWEPLSIAAHGNQD
jgi:short chain dehydrogenase